MNTQHLDYLLAELRKEFSVWRPACLQCKETIDRLDDFYRCWDCKAPLCERCAKSHMGNQHEPHPIHRHEIYGAVLALLEFVKLHTVIAPTLKTDDRTLAILHRAEMILGRFTTP